MTVLEADVSLDDLPLTWERDAGPFLLALLRGERRFRRGAPPYLTLAWAPIGMWRLPSRVGESVTSAWPAHFDGPLAATRAWELRVPSRGDTVADGVYDFPALAKIDTLNVSLTLAGVR